MKIFKASITLVLVIVLLICTIVQCVRQKAPHEDVYIVTVSEDCGTLNMNLIEPSVRTVTQQMVSRYYVDSLGFKNEDLYFMEIPKEVHEAIRDSAVNVLRSPKNYMRKVKFYRLKTDSIKH